MPPFMPQVLVLPHPMIPAQQGQYPVLSLREALQETYATDAHFALYGHPQRILKGFEPEDLRVGVTALDYDLPNHRDARAEAALLPRLLAQADPVPTHVYLTRGGARLIYEHDPVTPTEAEALHQALVERLTSKGIDCDPGCWQWNRIYRLPKVCRDGQNLDGVVQLDTGSALDLSSFDLSGPPRTFAVPRLREPMPSEQSAKALVWTPTQRGVKLTQWGREAQRRLKHRMDGELDACFQQDPPPLPDPRNDTLIRLAGSAASTLYGQINTTPEHVFGLLLERTHQSVRPTDHERGRNLLAECWKVVQYCWAQEAGLQQHQEDLKNEALQEVGEDALDRLVVRTHRGTYYVLQADGHYSPIAQMRETLPNALLRSGLIPRLTDLMVENQRGVRMMTPQEIITTHCLSVPPEVVKVPGRDPDHGWLENGRLHFGAYTRADLEPYFYPEVDIWLRKLFGRHYENACRWIGLALAFERGPICALSITSPKGTGKGLLVKGLAEATKPDHFAEAKNVFNAKQYEYGLDDSPWIIADEGWSVDSRGLANRFRTLVGGGRTTAEKKYAHPSQVFVAPRIVLTANNREAVEGLFSAPGLTQSDVDAIATRLFHVDCDDQAALWLDAKGSYDFTDGWVARKEGGRDSDFVLARHFLYLYHKHKDDPSMGRFLMQDLTDPALVAWLTVKNPHVSVMAEALLQLVRAGQAEDGWVTVGQVQDALRNFNITRQEYEAPLIGRHLRMLTGEKDEQRRRKIDWQKLEFYANETGRPLPQRVAA